MHSTAELAAAAFDAIPWNTTPWTEAAEAAADAELAALPRPGDPRLDFGPVPLVATRPVAHARESAPRASHAEAAESPASSDEVPPSLWRIAGALVPLNRGQKTPRDQGWRTRDYSEAEVRAHLRAGGNVGFRPPAGWAVLDFDPRRGPEQLQALAERLGLDLASFPSTATPSGGLHLYFRLPEDARTLGRVPGFDALEVKNRGQVVAPPSVHPKFPDGPRYRHVPTTPPYDLAPAAPAALLAAITRPARVSTGGPEEMSPARVHQLLLYLNPENFRDYGRWLRVGMAVHHATGGSAEGFAEWAEWSARDPVCQSEAAFICAEKWETFDRDRSSGLTGATLCYEVAQVLGYVPAELPPPVAVEGAVEPEPLALTPGRNKRPEPTHENARRAVAWLQLGLGYDTRSERVVVRGDSGAIEAAFPEFSRTLGDASLLALRAHLAETTGLDVSLQTTLEAAKTVALMAPFDPVREWLDSLAWDRRQRLDSWLVSYCAAEDSHFVRAVSRHVLLAAVARAYAPGTKFDAMLVLEGRQGAGKSSLVRILGGSYAVEDLSADVASKDCVDALRTAWFVEISELAALRRAEAEAFKSFVTRTVDRARLAYARTTEDYPRRCVLVGTTNRESGYLLDGTGNRRFWPVRVGEIRLADLERDREQLFAEAVREWKATPTPKALELPRDLWQAQAELADARQVHDPWEERLQGYLEGAGDFVTAQALMAAAGVLAPTSAEARRLSDVMQGLGWEPTRRRQEGGPKVRGYQWRGK